MGAGIGFFATKGALDRKPPHGSPCTQCGLCCVATLCPLATFVFGRKLGPCPALEYDAEGLSSCGLVANPARHAMRQTIEHGAKAVADAARHLIGAGNGCDARFNGEPINHAFYAELEEIDRRTVKQTRDAKRVWGVR